jgi:hypothetical protein
VTFPEFNTFQEGLFAESMKMRDTKGREYAGPKDRFDNFNRAAEKRNLHRLQAAGVFLDKHLDSINTYMNSIVSGEPFEPSEPMRGRFVDAITYLALIAGMCAEYEQMRMEAEHVKSQVGSAISPTGSGIS